MPFLSEFAVGIGIGNRSFLFPNSFSPVTCYTFSTPKPDTDSDLRIKNCCHLLRAHIQLHPPKSNALFPNFVSIATVCH